MPKCVMLALTLVLGASLCTAAKPPAAAAVAEAAENLVEVVPPTACDVVPLFKGDQSGWGRNLPGFQGADLVIRDPRAWEAFWRLHTGNITPAPELPPIDFTHSVVIATVQGIQTSGGGPNTAILGLRADGGLVHIRVFDDERPGMLDVITNPFHIVLVRRECLPPSASFVFEHVAPIPGTSVVTGHVAAQEPNAPLRPIPGAHVALSGANDEALTRHARTGLDGTFFFVDVPPRAYELTAEAPGFVPLTVPLEVPADALIGRDLVLLPQPPVPAAIVGHVAQPGTAGLVPLPGAILQLTREDQILATVVTDPNGVYGFNPVEPGPYVLRAGKEGFVPQAVALIVAAGQTLEQNFVLVPQPADVFGRFVGRVWGLAADGTQVPLGGATVRLLGNTTVVREVITNNEGRFVMEAVPPGQYVAVAKKPAWIAKEAPVTIVAGQTAERVFVLEPVPTVAATLTPAP